MMTWGLCRLCFKNNIEKNPGSIIIPAKNYNKNINKTFAGPIIGPAMAGPTGPFATALSYASRNWFKANKLSLNIAKTNYILFPSSKFVNVGEI